MINQFQDVFADEVQRRYLMTKANKDKLPLGFHDHYLIQGLRDQVEELRGKLLSATEALSKLEEASVVVRADDLEPGMAAVRRDRKMMSIQNYAIVIGSDLRVLDARSKEMIRILDQLQQTEVKL